MNRIAIKQIRLAVNPQSAISRRQVSHKLSLTPQQYPALVPRNRYFHNPSPLQTTSQKLPHESTPTKSTPKSSSGRPASSAEDIEIKSAPFSELGASKTVKIVVIVAISILATVETFTYSMWIYNKWFKKEEEQIEKE
jgi:hypothetical protein